MAVDLTQFASKKPKVDLSQFAKKEKKSRFKSAKEAFTGSFASAKEKFGRATKDFSLKDLVNPVKRAQRTMAALGGAGDVVSSPFAGATGLAQPEIEKGVKFAIEKTPQPVKSTIGKVVGSMSDDTKDFLGDTLSASALFGLSGLAKTPTKEVGKQAVKQTKKEVAKQAKKSVVRNTIKKTGQAIKKSGEKSAKVKKASFLDDLVRPKETVKTAKEAALRSSEKGRGLFKKTVTELSPDEKNMKDTLMKIKSIKPSDTAQGVLNKADDALKQEAKSLARRLAKDDIIFPKKELRARVAGMVDDLEANPFLSENKKAISKMLTKVDDLIEQAPARGSSLLKTRKAFDKWMLKQKSNLFSGNDDALKAANLSIRKTLNNFLDEKAIKVPVKDSLRTQRRLFDAIERLSEKAAVQARTPIGRAVQKLDKILGPNKLTKELIGLGVIGSATLSGAAPALAGVTGTYMGLKGLKTLATNPQNRIILGNLLKELSKQSPSALAAVPEIAALKNNIELAINQR